MCYGALAVGQDPGPWNSILVSDTPTRAHTAFGLALFVALLGLVGWLDRGATGAKPAGGAISGSVLGVSRYSVILSPSRGMVLGAGERVAARIEGRDRFFYGDHVPGGVYRLALIVDPDTTHPSMVIPVPLPEGVVDDKPSEALLAQIQQALDDFSRASVRGDPDEVIPFFSDDYRGASGQDRARKYQEIRTANQQAAFKSFEVKLLDGRGAGDRVLVLMAVSSTYQPRGGGAEGQGHTTMVSTMRRTAGRWQFARTDAVPLPRLDDLSGLPLRLAPASDATEVAVVAGRTTSLAKPIVVPPPS